MIKNKVVRTKANNRDFDGGYSELEQAFNDGWIFKNVVILNESSEAEYILEKDIDEEEKEDGTWLDNTSPLGCKFVCSICSSGTTFKHVFCPSCGKHMKNNYMVVRNFTPEGGY